MSTSLLFLQIITDWSNISRVFSRYQSTFVVHWTQLYFMFLHVSWSLITCICSDDTTAVTTFPVSRHVAKRFLAIRSGHPVWHVSPQNFRRLGAFFHEFLLPRDAWTGPHPAKTVPAHWIRITRLVRHVLNLISRMSVFIQGLGSTTSGNVLSASLTAPSGKTAATHNSSAFTHPRSGILSFFPTAGEKGYRLNHIARRTKVIFR